MMKSLLNWKWQVLALAVLILVGGQWWQRSAWRLAADFHHPFLAVGETGRTAAVDSALMLKGKVELARSVTLLQRRNEELGVRLALSEQVLQENAQLRQLLALSPRLAYRVVCAEVRSRDPLSWRELLTIDRGRDAGIMAGAVVLCPMLEGDDENGGFAVVGRVVEVSRHRALVATMFSQRCRLSVLLAESQFCGLAQGASGGGGPPMAWISHLPRDGQPRVGEMVLTSGYSGMTPPGLLLGWLASRSDGSPELRLTDNLHQTAGFLLAADLDRVRTVLVLTMKGSNK